MLYLEHIPAAPLSEYVRTLWYTKAPQVAHARERVLPSGCLQIIINLSRDFLWDCPLDAHPRKLSAALIIGARTTFEIIDTSDMADLIGVIFRPGGFSALTSHPADLFTNSSTSLDAIFGSAVRSLRDTLRDASTPRRKLFLLERFLLQTLASRPPRDPIVKFALGTIDRAPLVSTVSTLAKSTGFSLRHFSQLFRQQVGVSPKAWCRVQRFQHAVKQLHSGADVPWTQLALDCGFYDQSHFANEFRAFSGINPTSYLAARTRWANHLASD